MKFPKYLPEKFFTMPGSAHWATDRINADYIMKVTGGVLQTMAGMYKIIVEEIGGDMVRLTLEKEIKC